MSSSAREIWLRCRAGPCPALVPTTHLRHFHDLDCSKLACAQVPALQPSIAHT